MSFIQIIEYQTSRIDEVEALGKEFRENSAKATGGAKPLRGTVTVDHDRPGHYLSIIEFDSPESAMEASSRPETQEFFGRLSALMDGPPNFYNLDVVDTWDMRSSAR
jgi:quinol monooxygenase YgiN